MAGYEQALMQVMTIAIVEGLVFAAFLLTVVYMGKCVLDRVLFSVSTAGVGLAVHRDTVLDLGENTGDGRPASKPRILTEAEAEEAVS